MLFILTTDSGGTVLNDKQQQQQQRVVILINNQLGTHTHTKHDSNTVIIIIVLYVYESGREYIGDNNSTCSSFSSKCVCAGVHTRGHVSSRLYRKSE